MPGTNENRTPTPASSVSSLRRGHVRSIALAAAVVGVVVLPIAAAEANPSHGAKQPSVTGTPAAGAPGTAVAVLPQYCGDKLQGFGQQVSAQACVNETGGAVTGTVYVDNSTASPLTVVINLISSTSGSTQTQMSCTVAAGDANGECVTGALTDASGKGTYDAVAEAVPVGAPVADGVLHVESGQVAPASAGAGSPAA
ncbi:hypothetical protein [Actinospica robiniae]|uniref:hypothetical protein n=1 Tax=Actinospica robiniae TaxID=304901 RepID=UPI00040B7013|nr:hypothetical protein [Actinospica robiniae]